MADFSGKNDKVGQYLTHLLDDYVFDCLSDKYLKRTDSGRIMRGVPVPFRKADLNGGTISSLNIARNMAFVMGCDPTFKYAKNYLAFIKQKFPKDFEKPIIGEGADCAEKGQHEEACALFRGALIINPDSRDALFCYARACKDAYDNGQGDDYIGTFKAESLRLFEELTLKFPDFDGGFYYLGFAYVNLGLYMKSKLTFETFMKLSDDAEAKKEVADILTKLEEPVKIEAACNDVISGRYERGLAELGRYRDDERFNTWWPLWYYLGLADEETGDMDQAVADFKEALKYSPSNVDVMKELAAIYSEFGDQANAEKYRNKIKIVDQNAELDKEEREENVSEKLS